MSKIKYGIGIIRSNEAAMSTKGLVFFSVSSHYKNQSKHVGLTQRRRRHHFIECNLFSPWYSWKMLIWR